MSAPEHDTSEPRRPEWRRTPAERKAADFSRLLIRNRLALRGAAVGLVLGVVGAAIAVGRAQLDCQWL